MRISDWSSDVCSSDLDEARRRKLAGTLVISVAIRRDGSVDRADVIQSSGIKLLDAAAMRIAKLAEPYPPLPRTAENIEVLHVSRTLNFLPWPRTEERVGEYGGLCTGHLRAWVRYTKK